MTRIPSFDNDKLSRHVRYGEISQHDTRKTYGTFCKEIRLNVILNEWNREVIPVPEKIIFSILKRSTAKKEMRKTDEK